MKSLLILLLLVLFTGCTEHSEERKEVEEIPLVDQKIAVEEKIAISLEPTRLAEMGIPDSLHAYLYSFYERRNFRPKWINDSSLSQTGAEVNGLLNQPFSIGIFEQRLLPIRSTNFLEDELKITLSVAQAIHDIRYGMIDFPLKKLKSPNWVDVNELDSLLFFSDSTDLRAAFLHFGPSDSSYQVLATSLHFWLDHFPIDTSTFSIISIKLDSAHVYEKSRQALISKGYLASDQTDTMVYDQALRQFQMDNGLHPDGVVGTYTAMALNESTKHKIERILLSMDKIRSRNPRPEHYIYINIPDFQLQYYDNDSLQSTHRIIVGKPGTPTPELTARLRKIVVYPFWKVPYSISSKEILPAVKRRVGYLSDNHYRIYRKGEEINPYSVDWKKIRQNAFPFTVIQDPGPHNSLGILKFDFYNTSSVYFHDTPSKSLFRADIRAFSHGCMRTENPIDLAKIILERDEYRGEWNPMTPDSLDTLLGRRTNAEIKLLNPIPIYIEYQTAVRKDNKMILRLDLYGRDEEYLKLVRNSDG